MFLWLNLLKFIYNNMFSGVMSSKRCIIFSVVISMIENYHSAEKLSDWSFEIILQSLNVCCGKEYRRRYLINLPKFKEIGQYCFTKHIFYLSFDIVGKSGLAFPIKVFQLYADNWLFIVIVTTVFMFLYSVLEQTDIKIIFYLVENYMLDETLCGFFSKWADG